MQAILFALLSYFTWGTGVLVEAIVARKLKPYSLLFWSLLLSFIITTPYAIFQKEYLLHYTLQLLALNLVIGMSGLFLGTLAYFEAIRKENPVLVGTIASSFPLVTVISSVIFLGEKLSQKQSLAIILIFIGLILSMIELDVILKRKLLLKRGLLLAFAPMIMWGLYFTFVKILVEKVGWFWPNYISFLGFIPAFFYIKIRKIELEKPTVNNALLTLIISTILVRIAEFAYNLGITKGQVSIVAPIAGANPTLFVLLAFLVFKEPIKKQQILGIVITLSGIVLLSIFSA